MAVYLKKIMILFALLAITLTSVQAFGDGTASNTLESETNEVIINDIPLSYNIEIVKSNSRFTYDLLDARVTIKNKDSYQHYLEYKFIWYDESGFEISKNSSKWQYIRIDAKDTIVVKALAVTPKVDSFKFYIREKK